jgi:hypothetical protein
VTSHKAKLSNRWVWPTGAVRTLKAAALGLSLLAVDVFAGTHEATRFLVPSAAPDSYMQTGAEFAREMHPGVEISFWKSESGTFSVSRVEDAGLKCILRTSSSAQDALNPLGRFLNGRLDLQAQVLFAMAHEVGHCKLRETFLERPDGRAADPSAFPWLAQEAAADAYGILSVERRLGKDSPVRDAVVRSRMLASAMMRDPNHATGHYVSSALALCTQNRSDADAVQCAVSTAYFTVGSLANDAQGSPYPIDSPPELIYELGLQAVARNMHVYRDLDEYRAQFSGADLRRFAFREVSRQGQSRYIAAVGEGQADATYSLADYYGFRTGELVTEDRRSVRAMRIDGPDEFDWLLTLGAVVRTEHGESLRKGSDDAGDKPEGTTQEQH